jgi:hypothetical protein
MSPGTVPEAKAGGNYVTYNYKCPASYPVRWVTFDGSGIARTAH